MLTRYLDHPGSSPVLILTALLLSLAAAVVLKARNTVGPEVSGWWLGGT